MKLLAAFALFAVSYMAVGPTYQINWGQQEKAGGKMASYMPLGWNNGHFYTLQMEGKDGRLIKLDSKMNIASQKELITGQKKFEADVVYLRNNKIIHLTSDFENKEKRNYVRATQFSMDGKPESIKWKKVISVPVERNTDRADFQYFFSQDSSKLMTIHEHGVKGKDLSKISINVIDSETFEEIWNATTELKYIYKDVYILTAAVSNSGEVMLVATIKNDEGKRLEKYSTNIFSFPNKNKEYEEQVLKLEDKYLSSAKISYKKDGKAVMTGFYNLLKNGMDKGLAGAFLVNIDPSNLNDININTEGMDGKTLASITPSGALAAMFNLDQLNAYQIEEFEFKPDGSGYVVAEQRFMRETESGNTVRRTYYFNHLIIYRFNSDLEIEWFSTIPKQQVTSISVPKLAFFYYFPKSAVRLAYKYNSFISTSKDDKIYIMYNDHKNNGNARTLKETKSMSNKNTALASLVTIDPKGTWDKEAVFSGKDLGVILETSSSYKGLNGGFLLSGEKKSILQYGALNF